MPLIPSIFGTLPTATVTPGTFLEGAAYTMDMAGKVINATYDAAIAAEVDYNAKMDALTNATTGFLIAHQAADVTAGTISATEPTEPSMTISDTSVANVTATISGQSATIIAEAVAKFGTFIADYFPDNAATYTAAEAYLLAAISNTTSGIVPAAIKAAILEDSRARVLDEANRAEADLYETQSARRHRFPEGAAAGQARRIGLAAFDQISASIREVAIKDFELSHQTALEAVRMAIASRAQAIGAAQQYIAGVVAQGWSSGIQGGAAAHAGEVSKLQAAYQAYSARVGEADRKLKESQADKALSLDASKTNQSKDLAETEYQLKAFIQDAHLTAQKLVGMLNNLRAGSSATYSVST
jgi:hypothetical protein